MNKEILINSCVGETRMALLENEKLCEIRLFRDHDPSYVGAIYFGRISKLSKEFQAAFIDLPDGLNGFLPLKSLPKTAGKKPKDLTELLHEGQKIIVQVTADAATGKSLKLTGRVEIISTAVVLHPFRIGAYVSSRIKDPDRRADLKIFGEEMALEHIGLTFRTEAEVIDNKQLGITARRLIGHWRDIINSLDKIKCPALLSQGPSAVEQIMREFTGTGIDKIIIDQASSLKIANQWAKKFAPDILEKIEHYKNKKPLFSHYEIEDELMQISSANIMLNSGAWITIEETEALTVIDVNMGNALFSNDREIQIFKVNQQAAREIFRQLRLRSIGGLIVIDFINLKDKGQIKSFLHFIDELMLNDPVPIQRGNMSSFGLLEISRKSKQKNLNHLLNERRGYKKNISAQVMDLLRDAQTQSKPGQEVTIKVTREIKKFLEDHSILFDDFQIRNGSPLKMELI